MKTTQELITIYDNMRKRLTPTIGSDWFNSAFETVVSDLIQEKIEEEIFNTIRDLPLRDIFELQQTLSGVPVRMSDEKKEEIETTKGQILIATKRRGRPPKEK